MERCLASLEDGIEARVRARFAALQERNSTFSEANAFTLLDRMLSTRVQSRMPMDSNLLKLVLEK